MTFEYGPHFIRFEGCASSLFLDVLIFRSVVKTRKCVHYTFVFPFPFTHPQISWLHFMCGPSMRMMWKSGLMTMRTGSVSGVLRNHNCCLLPLSVCLQRYFESSWKSSHLQVLPRRLLVSGVLVYREVMESSVSRFSMLSKKLAVGPTSLCFGKVLGAFTFFLTSPDFHLTKNHTKQ